MDLASGIQIAYQRKWAMINTFTVQFILPEKLKQLLPNTVFLEQDELNVSISSFTTPDFTNDPIESYIANKWVIQNGRDSLYRFSITFKDYDQFLLYRSFMKIYNLTKDNYFDDVAMSLNIFKDADWYSEFDILLFEFRGTLIEGISNLSFSNDTENQIGEFTASFKCTTPIIDNVNFSNLAPGPEINETKPEEENTGLFGLGIFGT